MGNVTLVNWMCVCVACFIFEINIPLHCVLFLFCTRFKKLKQFLAAGFKSERWVCREAMHVVIFSVSRKKDCWWSLMYKEYWKCLIREYAIYSWCHGIISGFMSLKRGDCFVLLPKRVEFSNVNIELHTLLLLKLFDIHNVHIYLRLLHPLLWHVMCSFSCAHQVYSFALMHT